MIINYYDNINEQNINHNIIIITEKRIFIDDDYNCYYYFGLLV